MHSVTTQRRGERGFSLLLLVFSVTAFWQSYAISGFSGLSTAGVFPMLASATMVVSAACILFQNLVQSAKPSSHSNTNAGFMQSILPLPVVIMMALITAYLIAMPALGFLLSSAAFLFLSFSYLWRKSLLTSLLITAVSVASVYFIFRKVFQVVLPKGILLQSFF